MLRSYRAPFPQKDHLSGAQAGSSRAVRPLPCGGDPGANSALPETTETDRPPDREAAHRQLDQLRPGDTLVVWRLDRLGRSIRNLINQLQVLGERGAGFRSLRESIDTTSPGGRLVFHVFAEFERDLIKESTHAGLAAARARGRTGGRPPRLSADQVQTARRLYEQRDMTVAQIGDVLGVSRTTVYRALRRDSEPVVGHRGKTVPAHLER